jgi:chromosome segregation ATPase
VALSPPEPKSGRPELAQLVRRLRALTFELQELRRRAEPPQPELHAKERELEQLRWRFAAIDKLQPTTSATPDECSGRIDHRPASTLAVGAALAGPRE